MKILCTGDWHIRATNPRYRTDDYYESLFDKLEWIVDFADENDCQCILQPGDFFDYPDQSNKVEVDLYNLFANQYIYTVFGQHDCKYRNFSNTALYKFNELGIVKLLFWKPFIYTQGIHIYGASYDQEIPEVKDKSKFNILVIHKMITKDGPLWYDQQDYITAENFLKKYSDYDLVVSGDNHQSFSYEKNERYLINCGSLMRTTIAQRYHRPIIYILDTEKNTIEPHHIPVKPIEEVMNLELADEVKERTEELTAFIQGLEVDYDTELNFEENLKNLMNTNKTPDHIKNIANEIIGEYYE